ncbi:MAG: hypothetical protein FIB05_10735 [Betaproteobacteria bacterium]|nr:hypothetical protein [Betaproteobacteria bacterium]
MASLRNALVIAAFASATALSGCGGGGSDAPEVAPKTGEFVPSFGTNGIAALDGGPFTGTTASAQFAAADGASGVIRATGNLKSSSVRARLLPDGRPDAAFAGTGYVLHPAEVASLPFATERSGLAVFARPDGAELLVESVFLPCMTGPTCAISGGGSTYTATRLVDATGTALPAHGAPGTGEATLNIEPIQAIAEPSGAIVVLGRVGAGIGGIRRNALRRLTPQGLPDQAFDANAAVNLDCPGYNPIGFPGAIMARRPDGKLLVAQSYFTGSYTANPPAIEYTTCITRLLPDGTVDATFGAGGRSQLPREFQYDDMRPVAIFALPNGGVALFLQKRRQLEGKIHYHYMIATMTADGALDASRFDRGITGPTDLHVAKLEAVALQADGKYLVAGFPASGWDQPATGMPVPGFDAAQPRIGRLLPGGGADLSFGPLGSGYTPLLSFGQRLAPRHVSIGPDRGIFVAGALGAAGPVNDNEITKFAVGKLMGDSTAAP